MGEIYVTKKEIYHRARITHYPDGSALVMAADRAIFREPGWTLPDKAVDGVAIEEPSNRLTGIDRAYAKVEWADPERYMSILEAEGKAMETMEYIEGEAQRKAENVARAQRRARAAVRDLALCNNFRYFVTLTLDGSKVDRYDVKSVVKKLRVWADNAVRRKGLKYVLVPELHKDGALHFHGFFNDALKVVDSGTLTDGGKPRRPRSQKQRARLLAEGWHVVYNMPAWTLGFTTAIELYGDKRAAVAYVEKYITKEAEATGKIGGRWYYSGGDLARPLVTYDDAEPDDIATVPRVWDGVLPALGCRLVMATVEAKDVNTGPEAREIQEVT